VRQERPGGPGAVGRAVEVVVDSSEVGMRKPNPAIYHHALELLGNVPPERAVMLDDAPGNVAAAIATGLHASSWLTRLSP